MNRSVCYMSAVTKFGPMLVAAGADGLCAVAFAPPEAALDAFRRRYPEAMPSDADFLRKCISALQEYLAGERTQIDVPLDVTATPFQRQVWQALRAIPYGETRSYREIARDIGAPTAARAVARACASNPVAVVIPCHRVIRTDGDLGGFRWGVAVKRALLDMERLHKAAE